MEDKDTTQETLLSPSRRSMLKKSALATVGTGILGSSMGSAAAQEGGNGGGQNGDGDNDPFDEDLFVANESMKGLIFKDQWEPNNLFTIASPVLEFNPDVPEVNDNIWSGYNSRMIRILGTNETVLFFPANDAALGPYDDNFGYVVDDDFVNDNNELVVDGAPLGDEGGVDDQELQQLRPTVYAWNREQNLFGDADNLLTVEFSPIPDDQEQAVWDEFGDDFGFGSTSATTTGTTTSNSN